ncbi:unnamed protein product [Adineta ricciae]|uniref:Uncharacterized protein n=1 Tax=Adineta ricciae TaxID=249248 RepID=A0A816F025_ADIRI|nr:unnamed protein product [Adineta ricciae]
MLEEHCSECIYVTVPLPFDLFLNIDLLPRGQKLVVSSGKHTAVGEQHEFTIHTESFDAQLYVTLLHGCKTGQSIAGAQ